MLFRSPIILERARHHKRATRSPKTIIYPGERIRRGKAKPPHHRQQKQIANEKQIHITDLLDDNFEANYISDCKSIDFSCYIL